MVVYTDIPRLNALYTEQQQIRASIAMIDAGGTVSALTVAPAPPPPYDPDYPPVAGTPYLPVIVAIYKPATKKVMVAVREMLVERDNEIIDHLEKLEVRRTPPEIGDVYAEPRDSTDDDSRRETRGPTVE